METYPVKNASFELEKSNQLFLIVIISASRRYPWCNGYHRRKWTQQHEFKSWTRMITFSHSTNTLGKGMNPIILPPAMGK